MIINHRPSEPTRFSLYPLPLESHRNNMDRARVYEEKTVIHELTRGIEMAKHLRVNLHSPQARNLLIQKILSSYENALFVLHSGNPAIPAARLPESSLFTQKPETELFEFNEPFTIQQEQNTISKKRKGSITWEDQVRIHKKHTRSHGGLSGSPPPPPSPEKHEIKPTHHHKLSPPNPFEMLSSPQANVCMDTTGLVCDTVQSSVSFPLTTSFGLMDDLQQLDGPNHYDDGLWPIYSPPFISPATSESSFFGDWGSSSSLDLVADPDFEFMNSLFYN